MQLTRSLLHSVSGETYLDQINKTTETTFATQIATRAVKMHPFSVVSTEFNNIESRVETDKV